jgi:serine/threonine-protein kinase RsbW
MPLTTNPAGNAGEPPSWPRLTALTGLPQLTDLLDEVTHNMERAGYAASDRFAVRLALEEAAVNAVKHGHRHDPRKQVHIWWAVTSTAVKLAVQDEGPGFDPALVADPCLPENLERPCGRGLLLIKTKMTWVRFNRRGNCIAMCLFRSHRIG